MRKLFISAVVIISCVAGAAKADEGNNSKLPYKRADGWVWDWRTGLWRSPRPVRDPQTHQLAYETSSPTIPTCCDSTGLWFPNDAVNYDNLNPPDRGKPRHSAQPQTTPQRQQDVTAPDPNSLMRQIEKIRSSNMPYADQQRLISALTHQRLKEKVDDLSSIPDETAGAGTALYGRLSGYGAGQLEDMASDRRRHPENDPTLLDVVGAGLGAAGAVAGSYGYRGHSSGGMSGRQTVITPQRQYYPTAPRPNQSDITGLGK